MPPVNSTDGDASLRTNPTLYGTQGVHNQTEDRNDELQDTGTSPSALGDTMASEEGRMHDNDVPPINPMFPSCNEPIVQGIHVGSPAHCVVPPSRIDGVDMEGNASVPTLENIHTLNAAPVNIQEVATHPRPPSSPSQPRRLFKAPADVPQTSMCIPSPMHPIPIRPDPSSHVQVPDTMESDDDILLCFMQAFQRN